MEKKSNVNIKSNAEMETVRKSSTSEKRGGFFRWLMILIIVILIILGGLYTVSKVTGWNLLGANRSSFSNEWQAVFLSNGQVYFGQVENENNDTVVLKDIYYLQVTRALQPAQDDANQQNELSLVKLGNELHGPEDEMRINRDHILFIEDLKSDGKVVKAIQRYLETEE